VVNKYDAKGARIQKEIRALLEAVRDGCPGELGARDHPTVGSAGKEDRSCWRRSAGTGPTWSQIRHAVRASMRSGEGSDRTLLKARLIESAWNRLQLERSWRRRRGRWPGGRSPRTGWSIA